MLKVSHIIIIQAEKSWEAPNKSYFSFLTFIQFQRQAAFLFSAAVCFHIAKELIDSSTNSSFLVVSW